MARQGPLRRASYEPADFQLERAWLVRRSPKCVLRCGFAAGASAFGFPLRWELSRAARVVARRESLTRDVLTESAP